MSFFLNLITESKELKFGFDDGKAVLFFAPGNANRCKEFCQTFYLFIIWLNNLLSGFIVYATLVVFNNRVNLQKQIFINKAIKVFKIPRDVETTKFTFWVKSHKLKLYLHNSKIFANHY